MALALATVLPLDSDSGMERVAVRRVQRMDAAFVVAATGGTFAVTILLPTAGLVPTAGLADVDMVLPHHAGICRADPGYANRAGRPGRRLGRDRHDCGGAFPFGRRWDGTVREWA